MKTKMGAVVLAGAFFITAIPMVAIAGPGGNMHRQTLHIKTQSTQRISTQHRLRDGSSQESLKATSGAMSKKRNTHAYGPGDGTGHDGIGPKDGTGYGEPSKK
ncbi:MAG: hypothetical protein OEW45_15695 [Deltaproteobacteria bacterium]|nr:hypothetical protein [Deltaproteobacteria bacterium]